MQLSPVSESFSQEDESWKATAHGTQATRSITLDRSTFTAGTHYPNGYFPSGIPLGKITATGKYGPYVDGASDGTQTCVGFLHKSVSAGTTDVDPIAALYWHGGVITAKLPIAVDAAGKADLAGYIKFF